MRKKIHFIICTFYTIISPPHRQKLLLNVISRFKNVKLEFIKTDGFLDILWDNGKFSSCMAKSKFTVDTIVRCFPARFFKQYDKIIYSDVDVIFMDDISGLLDIDLNGKYIAAVKNAFMKYSKYELSHLNSENYNKLKDSYFAGGIWVFNLYEIRKDNLEMKMLDIIKDDNIIKRWNDQDVMNIACDNRVTCIPLNFISYPYLIDFMLRDGFTSHYSRDELFDSIICPKIIHFAGEKPWNGNPRYAFLWWSIFYYLGLSKTNIFTRDFNSQDKKLHYYRIIIKILVFILILQLCFILLYLYLF